MANVNARNFGQFTNLNLAAAPRIIVQKNNSLKVFLTGFYDDDFASSDGANKSKRHEIDLQDYVAPAADGSVRENHVYKFLTKGSPVSGLYETRKDPYTDKNGVRQYPQISVIRSITLLESKAATAERIARVAAEQNAAGTAGENVEESGAPVAAQAATQAPAVNENVDPLA